MMQTELQTQLQTSSTPLKSTPSSAPEMEAGQLTLPRVIPDAALYGIIAEFESADDLLAAAEAARDAGFKRTDAFTPFPLEGLSRALGVRDYWVPLIMLAGGFAGCMAGFALQYYTVSIDYPLNIGGRPSFSWPSYIPVIFELTVLTSAISGIVGMFVVNGLPMPYHPVFSAPNFERASTDRFFLCIEARDAKFNRLETMRFLQGMRGVLNVSEIEREL